MNAKGSSAPVRHTQQIMSAFEANAKAAETLAFSPLDPGQHCPRHCPQHCPQEHEPIETLSPLGKPLGIAEVAQILGCSPWTIRQKFLPQGLPHVRASKAGKIVFFRSQVIAWILKRQERKGGYRP